MSIVKTIKEIKITAFYNIFDLSATDAEILQRRAKKMMLENQIKGTMLIGVGEGINGTVAGSHKAIDEFYKFFKETDLIKNTNFKESFHETNPFDKTKVKLRKEIVTMGIEDGFKFYGEKGHYVKPKDWDDAINNENAVVIDTRNDYEYNIGTFKNAINPKINSFRELPQWLIDNKDLYEGKKLFTFCTGGMRCEKLTAWLTQTGIENYHLEGGILQYFEDTGNKNKMWNGHCFVFDNRVAVDDKLDAI